MSSGVIAMRLRLALLRHQIPVETDRLLTDTDYAVEIWALCKDISDPALTTLADRLMSSRTALRGPVPAGLPDDAEAAPPPGAARLPAASGSDADPKGDPKPPRERRYLRGAR